LHILVILKNPDENYLRIPTFWMTVL
jgi:hypothetical protein